MGATMADKGGDGFIPTSPACERAVSTTIQAMKDAGHTCIPIQLPDREYPSSRNDGHGILKQLSETSYGGIRDIPSSFVR